MKMDVNEKLVNNIISYFSEMKITEQFKNIFLSELKNDPNFQEKLKVLLDSDAETPGDEILWKRIIEGDVMAFILVAKEVLMRLLNCNTKTLESSCDRKVKQQCLQNLLPQETREKLFRKFEELLQEIFRSTEMRQQ